MNTKAFILSSSGLKNLVSEVGQDKEFKFIFGQQKISMKSVYAEFISPVVSKLHQTDPTINCVSFKDKSKDITLSKSTISKFLQLSKGESIEINEKESFEMKIISILIDNKELYTKLNDLYSSEINETNINNYLSNLTFFSKLSPSFNCFNYSDIIDTISSYFYLIDKKKLKKVPKSILYSIICNSNLRLESEDSLLDFVNDVFDEEDDLENLCLYEEVEYSMLSESKFEEFIENFDSSKMTHNIWSKLKICFYANKDDSIKEVNSNRYKKKSLENNTSKYPYGIIERLTKEADGNVHEKGVVNVTASSIYRNHNAKFAVDIHNNNNYFQSGNIPNSWLKYDFIKKKVHPTSYSIKTRHDHNGYHPRNWVIEGSNNDADWIILDSQQNETSLKGISVTRTFDINSHEENFRFLRIRQTGKESHNSDFLTLASLEFIGYLTNDQQ